jgi:hypothetical protein
MTKSNRITIRKPWKGGRQQTETREKGVAGGKKGFYQELRKRNKSNW